MGDLLEATSRTAFQSKIVHTEVKGEVYGVYSVVGGIGAIMGPIIGGLLYDKVSIAIPFYINGSMLIMACLIILLGKLHRAQNGLDS